MQAKAGDDHKDNSQMVEDEKKNLTTKEESKEEQPKEAKQAKIVVAIDAGHGGEDPGARGSSGTKEKDITLAIAKKLRDAINKEPNLQGVLIRDGDYFIPRAKRVAKARKLAAVLFVSIHADAFTKKSVK